MRSDIASAVERARSFPGTAPVTIVFADAAYASVLANWLAHVRALSIENVLVIALDAETHAATNARGIACARLRETSSRAELWIRRVELFAALVDAGIDFVHSDADAVWLRRPFAALYGQGVDIAFSQGTIWPPDVLAHWGFVLCCGLFAVRAGPAAASFFAAVADRMTAEPDDQIAVNRTLLQLGIVWRNTQQSVTRTWRGSPFRTFNDPVVGTCAGLSVALMPHAEFPRLPEASSRALVAHPIASAPAGPSQERRQSTLRRLGLWHPAESLPTG